MEFPEPVIGVAIEPSSKAEEAKLTEIPRQNRYWKIHRLRSTTDGDTGQTIISGMGELHLEIIVAPVAQRVQGFGAKVGKPQVAYKETVTSTPKKSEGKFDQLTGAKGQYGHVVIEVEPLETRCGIRVCQ